MDIKALAVEMIGNPIQSLSQMTGGGNNKIYKVCCKNGQAFALKFYSLSQSLQDSIRLEREYRGLSFLKQQGDQHVPAPVAISTQHICAVYDWIEGEKVTKVTRKDLTQVLEFIKCLKIYSRVPAARFLEPASDNALSIAGVIQQIERRLSRLRNTNTHGGLVEFLDHDYIPCLNKILGKLNQQLEDRLPLTYAMLSPSDFGFHNVLSENGKLTFIDFEYFGWEDPAAMLAHFLWHPATRLTKMQKKYFEEQVMQIFSDSMDFNERYQKLYPLIGLVWTLILLNEFIPELWQRRVEAGGMTQDQWQLKCATQLQNAKNYLVQIG